MCTVSWIHSPDGYELFFNRDEKHTRLKALPPFEAKRQGVRFLAPIDSDSGGTWIAVNQYGLCICLLNGANLTGSALDTNPVRSRGILLPDLISSPSLPALQRTLEAVSLVDFAPFTLAALQPGEPAFLAEWNGSQRLTRSQPEPVFMVTSSSFQTEDVTTSRRREFELLLESGGEVSARTLMALHESHAPSRSAYSVCMHRSDAETVSFTRIHVAPKEIELIYSPDAPCQHAPETRLNLAVGNIEMDS